MFNIPEDYEPLGFKWRVPKKRKMRAPQRRTKEDLAKFLTSNGVKYIKEKNGEFQFLGIDDELREPGKFFGRLEKKVLKQKQENTEIYWDFRGHSRGTYIPVPQNPMVRKFRPINQNLRVDLENQKHDVQDFQHTWLWLVKRVNFKVDQFPDELIEVDSVQKQDEKIAVKARLSRKDSRELSDVIVFVIDHYVDQGNTQERAFHLAATNSKKHFRKWLKLAMVNYFSKGQIEGRYKRFMKSKER